MELETKMYNPKELAEWFNVVPKTFSNNRKKYLEELKYFADFEDLGGKKGILIKKVFIPVYAKKKKVSRAYQIIKDNFHKTWHSSGYDTAARVGSQIWKENEELQQLISEATAKQYVLKARTEFYGKVYDRNSYGELGICKPVYIARNSWDEAILLTDEQIATINKIRREIYDDEQAPMLDEALIHHEITEEEYERILKDYNSREKRAERYYNFINRVADELGIMPDKVTLIIKQLRFK